MSTPLLCGMGFFYFALRRKIAFSQNFLTGSVCYMGFSQWKYS